MDLVIVPYNFEPEYRQEELCQVEKIGVKENASHVKWRRLRHVRQFVFFPERVQNMAVLENQHAAVFQRRL